VGNSHKGINLGSTEKEIRSKALTPGTRGMGGLGIANVESGKKSKLKQMGESARAFEGRGDYTERDAHSCPEDLSETHSELLTGQNLK